MTRRVLVLYSTVDGHTREIAERVVTQIESAGITAELELLTPESHVEPNDYDAVVLGASIRYGKHRPEVAAFIAEHVAYLATTPSAFFSVNAVARKPAKQTPETNPYVRKFLGTIRWQPALIGIFAGRIDYPRYSFFDRHMIRLIMWMTKGPTDLAGSFEFTDWEAVDRFGREFVTLLGTPETEPQ